MKTNSGNDAQRPPHPDFREAARLWGKIGLLSFGGPAGQIALMHRELVDERRWISESRFLHALNFCMLLPGPEAQQLATYIGWLLHGWRGGVVAGTLFVLPGFLVILGLSAAYALFQEASWMASLFFGLKAAVLAIVIEAVLRVARRSLKNHLMLLLAGLSFVALFGFDVPFPVVVVAAGLIGYAGSRIWPSMFVAGGHRGAGSTDLPSVIDELHVGRSASAKTALSAIIFWAGLWLLPFLLIAVLAGGEGVYDNIAVFFSQMAVVTFGGAYAVLSYVAQQAVDHYHWLQPGEMLDGLALAETTPGPLVLVLTFVGFMAAFRSPGDLTPLAGGVVGALLTTWVTFIPCFLWIFLGAPYVEKLRANVALSGALAAISAAVTGVLLNLAVWFALHVLFSEVGKVEAGPLSFAWPVPGSLNPYALLLAGLSAVLVFRFKTGTITTLSICGVIGVVLTQAGLA